MWNEIKKDLQELVLQFSHSGMYSTASDDIVKNIIASEYFQRIQETFNKLNPVITKNEVELIEHLFNNLLFKNRVGDELILLNSIRDFIQILLRDYYNLTNNTNALHLYSAFHDIKDAIHRLESFRYKTSDISPDNDKIGEYFDMLMKFNESENFHHALELYRIHTQKKEKEKDENEESKHKRFW